jgi:hypothetical protein
LSKKKRGCSLLLELWLHHSQGYSHCIYIAFNTTAVVLNSNAKFLQDLRNTVGNIPMNWYADYPPIGYDLEGKKILKPARGDEIDNFLRKMENPESWYLCNFNG